MFFISSRSKPISIALFALILCAGTTVSGQPQSTRKTGRALPTSISVLEGTRQQDGLIGPVRRVRAETAKLSIKSGKLTEGPHTLLETTVYNLEGNRIENAYYPVPESHNLQGKEEYKYDDRGNVTEMTLRDQKGAILSREVYAYEFDKIGNWKKMTTSLMVYENALRYEPVEVTYRSISYYFNETTAKVENSSSPTTAPVGVSVADTVKRPPRSQVGNLVNANGTSPAPGSPRPEARRISGALADSELVIPKADYPDEARQAGVTGTVAVKVTLDPQGQVIEARAINGPPMLRASAVEAALKARLSPGPKTQSKRSAVISFTFSLLE